ncbi:2-hydroxyacid dehydrogenase [Salinicoccus hispanicus]|uniref:D-lactate dehydrogenase n=1 Tax=Salinicoccus hispanicus TaxID=157225 RepID=A0A6N8U4H3_9STAP|nr:D-glycerate dehydrogenase [Salinicoccus hispanicus]MXQ51375.1 bifunctional glyoxylate/hydroxypyruvate reductase B [Salinicoccus hispanicus]
MKPKVLIMKPIPDDVEKFIAEHCDYEIWNESDSMPEETLFEKLATVDGLMPAKEKINDSLLDHAPNLKIISNISVGYDNFDTDEMKKRGIMGTNTPYVLDETVADTAFGLLLMTARKFSMLDRHVKTGGWDVKDDPMFLGRDVHHATLGIFGLGRIGEKVIRRAVRGFDMNVIYHNRSRNESLEKEYGIDYRSKEEVLKQADFILTLLPLTEQTTNYISKEEFDLMKADAFLIHLSRGKVVDEAALIQALKEKRIAGAGLDVYEEEPVSPDNSLLGMDNVVTLPHVGSATQQTRDGMAMRAAENLVQGLQGEKPKDLVKELDTSQ